MTTNPIKKPGTRLCIAIDKWGVTVYGNKKAFESLTDQMSWIAKSDESEHFECHVTMHLMDDESLFEGKEPKNVWVLQDKVVTQAFVEKSKNTPGFELTFMAVTEKELDDMAQFQKTGLLPEEWNQEEDD